MLDAPAPADPQGRQPRLPQRRRSTFSGVLASELLGDHGGDPRPVREFPVAGPVAVQAGAVVRIDEGPEEAQPEPPVEQAVVGSVAVALQAPVAGPGAVGPVVFGEVWTDERIVGVVQHRGDQPDDDPAPVRLALPQPPTEARSVDEEVGDLQQREASAQAWLERLELLRRDVELQCRTLHDQLSGADGRRAHARLPRLPPDSVEPQTGRDRPEPDVDRLGLLPRQESAAGFHTESSRLPACRGLVHDARRHELVLQHGEVSGPRGQPETLRHVPHVVAYTPAVGVARTFVEAQHRRPRSRVYGHVGAGDGLDLQVVDGRRDRASDRLDARILVDGKRPEARSEARRHHELAEFVRAQLRRTILADHVRHRQIRPRRRAAAGLTPREVVAFGPPAVGGDQTREEPRTGQLPGVLDGRGETDRLVPLLVSD